MDRFITLIWFGAITAIWPFKSSFAQTPTPLVTASEGTAASAADFNKAAENIVDALEGVRSTIKSEIAAQRMKRESAAGDVSRVELLAGLAERGEFDTVSVHARGGFRNRANNPALDAAWEKFAAALRTHRKLFEAEYAKLVNASLNRAVQAWHHTRRYKDLSGAITDMRTVENLARGVRDNAVEASRSQIGRAIRYLESFRELRAAEESGNASLIGEASRRLKDEKMPFGDLLSAKEMEERRVLPIRKLRAEAATILKESLAALPGAKAPEELTPIVEQLHAAAELENGATGRYAGDWDKRYEAAEYFAGLWQKLLVFEVAGAWEQAAQSARDLEGRAREVAPTLMVGLSQRSETALQREREAAKARVDLVAVDLPRKLARLTDSAGTRALAVELRSQADGRLLEHSEGRALGELVRDLDQLALAWRAAEEEPSFSAMALAAIDSSTHPWRAELAVAREGVRRKVVAARLDLPELLQPPLNQRPIAEVLRARIDAAVEANGWREAHRLVQTLVIFSPDDSIQQDIGGIRAFLVGQNFEKAGLFSDAVHAYRAVLSSAGISSPIAIATERLKALRIEHPEIFKNPSK